MSDTTTTTTPGRGAHIAIAIGRILFGLLFLGVGVMGLLMFFHVMQEPKQDMAPAAQSFVTALHDSGYMSALIAITQLVVGLLMVVNRFVPLALALIAPFMVNSVCFHLFLERNGLIPSLVITALMLALAWAYRGAFRPMLAARARPGA